MQFLRSAENQCSTADSNLGTGAGNLSAGNCTSTPAKTIGDCLFGGSFTAIPEKEQNALLEAVQPFLAAEGVTGIRISTRPDCITPEILQRLQQFHVTAIELGAQSMQDAVLQKIIGVTPHKMCGMLRSGLQLLAFRWDCK